MRKRIVHSLRNGGLVRQVAEQTMANIAIQGLGAITTLSFVHLLPLEQYALFGLCISTVNFIAVTSDLGLTAAMNYFWRHSVAGRDSMAERYAAIKRVRLMLFALSGLVATSVLGWLTHREGAPVSTALLSMGLVLVLAWAQINAAMIIVPLRLSRQLRRAYSIELTGALLRAGLAILAFALALREAWFPLASLGLASLVMLILARRHMPPQIRDHPRPGRAAVRGVLTYILPTIPGSIVFAMQDLFVYWLAALSGGATVVAQTFALGRLAAIFVTLSSVMSNVIMPRVVNLADDRHAHRNGMIPIGIIAVFCLLLIAFAALFPQVVLTLLGSDFHSLRSELLLSLGAATFALVAQMQGQLSRTMGWVRWETPMIAFHAALLVTCGLFWDFSTTAGVLSFNLLVSGLFCLEMGTINLLGHLGVRSTVALHRPK